MKKIAILSIAVIGLLSLSLIHSASANEAAFRAAADKAWQEIQAHDTLPITPASNDTLPITPASNDTLPITPTPNGTNYGINATSANATGNLGSTNSSLPVMP